jgi:hypothetical protein
VFPKSNAPAAQESEEKRLQSLAAVLVVVWRRGEDGRIKTTTNKEESPAAAIAFVLKVGNSRAL